MKITLQDGHIALMLAAYRIGAGDPEARAPEQFLRRCIRMIEADTREEAADACRPASPRTEGES